jgi:hypothetical protein
MKSMFDKPLLETYELITGQWQQLQNMKKINPKVCTKISIFLIYVLMHARISRQMLWRIVMLTFIVCLPCGWLFGIAIYVQED